MIRGLGHLEMAALQLREVFQGDLGTLAGASSYCRRLRSVRAHYASQRPSWEPAAVAEAHFRKTLDFWV